MIVKGRDMEGGMAIVGLGKGAHPVRFAGPGRSFAVLLAAAALGVSTAACSGGADDVTTTTLSTSPAPAVIVSTTSPASTEMPVTTTITPATTTSGLATSSTLPGESTNATTSADPDGWQSVSTSLTELASRIAQRLPEGQSVDLPDHLPAGWALARSGQVYGDAVAGYLADITENPTVTTNDGVDQPFGEYRAVFTDGRELVVVMVVIGDWGETEFQEVTAYDKTLLVYQDENIVVARAPGWDFGTAVGSPGAREAVLEMAASIKSW